MTFCYISYFNILPKWKKDFRNVCHGKTLFLEISVISRENLWPCCTFFFAICKRIELESSAWSWIEDKSIKSTSIEKFKIACWILRGFNCLFTKNCENFLKNFQTMTAKWFETDSILLKIPNLLQFIFNPRPSRAL